MSLSVNLSEVGLYHFIKDFIRIKLCHLDSPRKNYRVLQALLSFDCGVPSLLYFLPNLSNSLSSVHSVVFLPYRKILEHFKYVFLAHMCMEQEDSDYRSQRELEKVRRLVDYLVKNPKSSISKITESMPFSRSTVSRTLHDNEEFREIPVRKPTVDEPTKVWVVSPGDIRDSRALDSDKADQILRQENNIVNELRRHGLLENPDFGKDVYEFLLHNKDKLDYNIRDKDLNEYSEGEGLPARLARIFLEIWVEYTSRADDCRIEGNLSIRSNKPERSVYEDVMFNLDIDSLVHEAEQVDIEESDV